MCGDDDYDNDDNLCEVIHVEKKNIFKTITSVKIIVIMTCTP